jgi:hypothetical protein
MLRKKSDRVGCWAAVLVAGCLIAGLDPTTAAASDAARDIPAFADRILEESSVQGGLVVVLGLDNPSGGELMAALGRSGRFLIQGLDVDETRVAEARLAIESVGHYGSLSVDRWRGTHLPYIDHLVNLIVVSDRVDVPRDELSRVLRPRGVVVVIGADAGLRVKDRWNKPRPEEMDDWTHYLYDATGNAVSRDRMVDFPRQYQWIGGPRYSRHHDHMSSASAMVSAEGRLFSIFDHASPFSIQLPSQWQLVARDAFNGAVLWRREMGPWFSQMQRLKSGPSNLPRRLVAVGTCGLRHVGPGCAAHGAGCGHGRDAADLRRDARHGRDPVL